MKRTLFFCLLCLISLSAYSQLEGDFYKDNTGSVYFCLDNPSPYPISLMWCAKNYEKNSTREEHCVLPPYSRLTVGPNNGWIWEAGEYFFVVSDYQKLTYRCKMTDSRISKKRKNPSFKGRSSCHIKSHNCPYGVDRNSDRWCDNCMSNGYKCHMVNHQSN